MAQNDQALMTRLNASGLEFVIIGGVSAAFHGSLSMATFILEVCCPLGEENVARIESAVHDLHPVHRLTTNRLPLEMTRSAFGDFKNLYLQTDLGKLDCLSEVAGVGGFDDVRRNSVVAKFSNGEFRFLPLDALITSKQAAGRERDLLAVRHLRAIKEKGERQQDLF
jgi:hypothetical protein